MSKETLLYVHRIVFDANEALLNGDVKMAQNIYCELMKVYKELPNELKIRAYQYASKLRRSIIEKKTAPIRDEDGYFVMYNGKVVRDLYHLVYVLDTITDSELLHHVSVVSNDLYFWIKRTLREENLAELIKGVRDRREIKETVLRYLLLEKFNERL
jgi:hypothetical protein